MSEKKPTKAQRAKLLDPQLATRLRSLSDDELLAAHDLMHDEMLIRHGTNKRSEAESKIKGGDDE